MAFPIDLVPLKVLVLTYPSMDALDIIGPLDAFSHAIDDCHNSVFRATIAGVTPRNHTNQWVSIAPDIDYESALQTCSDYDLLLVPGAETATVIEPSLRPDNMIVRIIKKFSQLTRGEEKKNRSRILLSICTGSYFLAYLGIYQKGWQCTTHYDSADKFRELLKIHCSGAEYVETTYVDSGFLENGINVIDSGGVSNSIDAALYVITKYFGPKFFDKATSRMDYRNMVRCGIPPMKGCHPRPSED